MFSLENNINGDCIYSVVDSKMKKINIFYASFITQNKARRRDIFKLYGALNGGKLIRI